MPREPMTIRPLPAAEKLAAELIEAHHPDLAGAKMLWLVTTGKVRCKPKVLNPFERYLSSALEDAGVEPDLADGYDLVCTLNDQDWLLAGRGRVQAAMVDHLLSHIERVASDDEDSTLAWRILKHPVEEFPGVVRRHGLWTDVLKSFGAVVSRQIPLPIDGEVVAVDGVPVAAGDRRRGRQDAPPTDGDGERGLLYDDVRSAIATAAADPE
jgi:hypothetical protein